MAKAAYPTIGIAAFVVLVMYFIGCLRYILQYAFLRRLTMSIVCSLLATCKAHEVNPREYLNDVIARMPYMQNATYDELLQLLPHKWKK